MSVSQVGSIDVTGFSSCRSSDSLPELEALSAPLRRVPERPDSPSLNSRVTVIPVSTRPPIRDEGNEEHEEYNCLQLGLARAFLESRDGGRCCVYSLACTVVLCCCVGIGILLAGVVVLAVAASCSGIACDETYKIGVGVSVGGAVGILLGFCAWITRGKLEPYYQLGTNQYARVVYATTHNLDKVYF